MTNRCVERTAYLPDGKVRFFGDMLFSVFVRASSYTGARPPCRSRSKRGDQGFLGQSHEDPNESPCARQQEERLHRMLAELPRPSDCIRCGLPVTQPGPTQSKRGRGTTVH